jgi:glycosyltransferase involved in cell wall biosynthesis
LSRCFPRLLIATEFPPDASGGGPAVVRQLLKNWPPEKLAWWSCLPGEQRSLELQIAMHRVATIPRKLYPHFRLMGLKAWVLKNAWAPWAAKHLRGTIREYRPDVIWTIPNLWSILPLANVLPTAAVPYRITIHDYPDTRQSQANMGRATAQCFLSLVENLYTHASSRDVISYEMAADLKEKTGYAADEVSNASVESEDFAYLEQKKSSNAAVIKVAHAGTIISEEAFVCLIQSLARIRERLPKPIELHLFGSHSYRERSWFAPEWMIERGNLSPEKFKTALRECQWGISAMELTDENPRYNRFSLPSKTVTYLAAGLAIISLGHKDSTIVHLAHKHSFGIALEDADLPNIDDLLKEALGKQDVWSRYGENVLRCARNDFNAESMRAKLYTSLGVRD